MWQSVKFSLIVTAVLSGYAADAKLYPNCFIDWERTWYNDSHPTNYNEYDYEPLPNITILNNACPDGTLVVRCTPDPDGDISFQGYYRDDAYDYYEAECSTVNGSVCYAEGEGGVCPDHAIQLGCDRCQVPISPSPCGITSGSITQAPPTSICNCQKADNQHRSDASFFSMPFRSIFFSLIAWFLVR